MIPTATLTVAAPPGEANSVVLTFDAAGYVVRDAGAPLRPATAVLGRPMVRFAARTRRSRSGS